MVGIVVTKGEDCDNFLLNKWRWMASFCHTYIANTSSSSSSQASTSYGMSEEYKEYFKNNE